MAAHPSTPETSPRIEQDPANDRHDESALPVTPAVIPSATVPPAPVTAASNGAAPTATAPEAQASTQERSTDIFIYSHSSLFYWWPLWVGGYAIAGLIALFGEPATIHERTQWFFPGSGVGVIYSVLFLLVVLITNVSARGIASVVVILSVLFVTVLFAWLGWWDTIFRLIPQLDVHMNLGFYLFISTALFLVWALSFFLFDRLSYWRIKPGQMTEEHWIGNATQSYDTRGMVFEKYAGDPFRHVVLGLGAGDLKILTSGARKSELYLANVLFVDRKVTEIQNLIAVQPDMVTETSRANS